MKSKLLLDLQEKINSDVTMRFLNLSHCEIGKLSLANLRKLCHMLSRLECLYAIDLSGNNLCDLTPLHHTVLLDSLRKLPYLSRVNLSENNLLQLNKLWLNEYLALISKEKCAVSLNVNNTDLAVSILEDMPSFREENKDAQQTMLLEELPKPLRLENFTQSLSSNLTELSLSQTNLSQVALTLAAWKTLCQGLGELVHLRVIDLSSNQLSTVALVQRGELWKRLKQCRKLWCMNLQDNGFDHDDIEILKQIFKKKDEDENKKNQAKDDGKGHDLFGVNLDDGFYQFKPRGRHFFEMSASLTQKMDQGDFPNTIRALSQIAIMFPQKKAVRDLRKQLSELDSKITLSSSERSGPNLSGLFFSKQQLRKYQELDTLYSLPDNSPRILHAKTALRYKKSLVEQNKNLSLFCDQFQRTFDSLYNKLALAAEGEFTKNGVNIGFEGFETLAELAEHLIHVFRDSASDLLKDLALVLPLAPLAGFIYECAHVYNVTQDARAFMAFVRTPQRAAALGEILAYNLSFQLHDEIIVHDCSNQRDVIFELARKRVKDMIKLMLYDVTQPHLDVLLLGEELCTKYMESCRSQPKELSQQTLDRFVEQETKKRTL